MAVKGTVERHLRGNMIDPDKLVKANDLQQVTNPVFFARNNVPTPDGLLSNEIFGITKADREGTFAYIDLFEPFMSPLIYKIWSSIDSAIRPCVHGTKTYIISDKGELVEDENGENGIKFLKKNIDKIRFRRTESNKRDMKVDFLERWRKEPGTFFITKCPVLPAYYRDVETGEGRVSVGEINQLYDSLLISIRALKESHDYGLNLAQCTRGRIQEALLQIFNWFGTGATINGEVTSKNIPGKLGIYRRAVNSKTTDYASRLVISAPENKVERMEDMEVTMDYSGLSLASTITNFLPFIIFEVRRFFENEFSINKSYPVLLPNKQVKYVHVKNYQEQFSDERIKKEIDRFVTGFSNRLIPITAETIEGQPITLRFKGYNVRLEDFDAENPKQPLMERDLTWMDVFYMAAVRVSEGKHILITRFPIDTYYNQFPNKFRVMSTNKTEPMIINNEFYPRYPMVRQSDIGSNTSNMFKDTLNMSNLHLDSIGGDYDGDQVTAAGVYSVEANAELEKFMNSKAYIANLGGKTVRTSDKEAILALYSLTYICSDDRAKITKEVKFA